MDAHTYGGVRPPGFEERRLAGKLIVVEGTDGVGRSTQIDRLTEWLESMGLAVLSTGLTRSALVAADRALLVTEPTIYSVAGVQRAFEAVQHEREHNPYLQTPGVLVNRVRVRSSEHNYRLTELREIFGPLVLPTVLPDRSVVQQAQGAGLPIQRWDTPGAREVSAVFTTLLGRVLRSDRPRRLRAETSAPPPTR